MDAKTIVWVRAGGRCAICNRYLLDDTVGTVVPVGENAHIVGRDTSDGSPRGDYDLPLEERDKPENLVLLCREQHKIIDNNESVALFSVEELREIKRRHEEWIFLVTEMRDTRSTAVLRVVGRVRGAPIEANRRAIAAAVLAHGRYPVYPFSFFGDGLEVDLRELPEEGSDAYYSTAIKMIDPVVEKLSEGVRTGRVAHISLFAFARIPLLVYLGHRLDDTFPVDIYQRHRATESWAWDDTSPPVSFRFQFQEVQGAQTEAVLIVNASGTIQSTEIPEALRHLPFGLIDPVDRLPDPDIVRNCATRSSFEQTFRGLLAHVEQNAKHLQRLHLLAAVPVSLACTIGRVVNTDVAPTLIVYELQDGVRRAVVEVGP